MFKNTIHAAVAHHRQVRAMVLWVVAWNAVSGCPGIAQQAQRKAAAPAPDQAIEFSDKPSFSVAGVTDWTAVGGHGSDATLRTSEDLTRETLTLKAPGANGISAGAKAREPVDDAMEARLRSALAAAPRSYAANHALGEYYLHSAHYRQALPPLLAASELSQGKADDEYDLALACQGVGDFTRARQHVQRALAEKDTASFHRVAGEVDEALGNSLAAVQQEERAARMDPSETNYFVWGSELLLHRAIWQAAEVFASGVKEHPASARMKTGWGAALFAGAQYDEAAERLCEASDLDPASPEPYVFLSKVALASPAPLSCVQAKLERFIRLQPASADAVYFYAMVLHKQDGGSDRQRVEGLLRKAVALDPKYSAAYLQLGILAFAERRYQDSIGFYKQAIENDPKLAEAHYRLGVVYDRTGDAKQAREEFQEHDRLEKQQADAVEQQRRQVKQFLVVLEGKTPATP